MSVKYLTKYDTVAEEAADVYNRSYPNVSLVVATGGVTFTEEEPPYKVMCYDSEGNVLYGAACDGNPIPVISNLISDTTSLVSVNLGDCAEIGDSSFSNLGSLAELDLGEAVITIIPNNAFNFCSSLKVDFNEQFPDVTSIGDNAFSYSGLTSVDLQGITDVGLDAFTILQKCTDFDTGSMTAIGVGEFSNFAAGTLGNSEFKISPSVKSIGKSSFTAAGSYGGYTKLTIEDGLTPLYVPNGEMCLNSSYIKELYIGRAIRTNYYDNETAQYVFHNFNRTSGAYPRRGNNSITKVRFGSNITKIPGYICDGFTVLNDLTIPNTVASIGSAAFNYCTSLTSVTIPNSVTSIDGNAFANCTGLTSVTIPNSVTYIGSYAFYGTPWYTNWWNSQPDGVVYLNNVCMGYKGTMPANTSIEIASGTTEIAGRAFYGCTGLASITIPNSVTVIGSSAFSGCSGLTSITIPNGVTEIESQAFWECTGLTSVTVPNSVTSIGTNAFQNCSGLTSITIGNGVISIGQDAFWNCRNLTSVYITDIDAWCKIAFHGSLSNPLFFAHHLYLNGSEVTNLVIPNTVTSIGKCAFYECTGLTSITIPNTVTSIGGSAFYNTGWYNAQPDGMVYAGKVAYKYKGTMPANTSIEIASGTTEIANDAFYNCTNLTSITIPNSVTSIESQAFYGCTGLTSITIPNSVTVIGSISTTDNGGAFANCTGLTSVTIPSSVTNIGKAFEFCRNLTSLTFESTTPPVAHQFLRNANDCRIYVPATSVNDYKRAINFSDYASRIQAIPSA